MVTARKKLITKLGSKEDGKFLLFNLDALRKLITSGDDKKGWYCIGRRTEKEGETLTYCVHAYSAFSNNGPVLGCTADCPFYNGLHNQNGKI